MPTDNNTNGGTEGTENNGRSSAFSPDYVKELREEAASWRTKYRETEQKVQTLEQNIHKFTTVTKVKEELNKRGLSIDPDFIKLDKDGDATTAIDNFLEKYPQFAVNSNSNTDQPVVKKGVRPITTDKTNTNNNPAKKGSILDAKSDPIARTKLRQAYRNMLGRGE